MSAPSVSVDRGFIEKLMQIIPAEQGFCPVFIGLPDKSIINMRASDMIRTFKLEGNVSLIGSITTMKSDERIHGLKFVYLKVAKSQLGHAQDTKCKVFMVVKDGVEYCFVMQPKTA